MPSHTFAINPQMREKWMKNLILKPYKKMKLINFEYVIIILKKVITLVVINFGD